MSVPATINSSCPDGVPAFQNILDLCVNDTRSWFAVICGIISILAWVVYGLPQMIINCRKGIPQEAISPWLLVFWTIGDTSNMVGAILTKQLKLQIVMAAYAILCDIVLVSQFSYSVLKRKWLKSKISPQTVLYEDNGNYIDSVSVDATKDGLLKPRSNSNVTKVTGAAMFCIFLFTFHYPSFQNPQTENYIGRTLLSSDESTSEPFLRNYGEIVGYILGCLSSLFYSSGRVPQMCMNFRRKCTEGLSAGLFIFAIIGNATYGAQILLVNVETMYILKHLPWILGSWGVMLLDCIILIQFFIYRKKDHPDYMPINCDDSDEEILS